MTPKFFRSTESDPFDRGHAFGAAHAHEINTTVEAYQELFDGVAGHPVDIEAYGMLALDQIGRHVPYLGAEITGIAAGAGIPQHKIAAVNARTEILATLGHQGSECTTVVGVSPAARSVAVQCWDWYSTLAENWLTWEITHPDGRTTTTVTEYGIVGKIGVNSRGIGVLFNILHHRADGDGIGVPVHVLARSVLDRAADLHQALVLINRVPVSASTCLTVVGSNAGRSSAVAVELNPAGVAHVLPDERGILVHSNHFLHSSAAVGDTELRTGPDTLLRLDQVQRALDDVSTLTELRALQSLDSHQLGGGSTCAHPDPDPHVPTLFQTLATITIDVEAGALDVHPAGPCTHPALHPTAATRHNTRHQYTDDEHAETDAQVADPHTHRSEEQHVITPPTLKRVDNMDILSHDVDRLARFYTEVLGLEYFLPYEQAENWAAIDLGNLTLYIFQSTVGEHPGGRTAINAQNPPGMDSFAFEVDDLDTAEAALQGRVEWVDERIEWKHPGGSWYRYRPFYDPDGNMLYITEPHISPAS